MSSDLIALVVALALGAAVVIVGLRRNLSETTRNGLPRFGVDPARAPVTLEPYEGGERRRRPLSPRQRRWLISIYLLLALSQAASAVLSSSDKLAHAATAAFVLLGVVALLLKKPAHLWGEPAS
jgi:hypothetical protein